MRETDRRARRQRAPRARSAPCERCRERRRRTRARRPRIHPQTRTARERDRRLVVAEHRHRRRRVAGEDAAEAGTGRRRHLSAGHQSPERGTTRRRVGRRDRTRVDQIGIVDAESLVKTLLKRAQDAGVIFLPGTKALSAERRDDGLVVATGRESIHARIAVNAAGLYADDVSALLGGEPFTIYPCRGEYAELVPAKRSLVSGLVYPLPHAHSLGVHLVKTIGGEVGLGPATGFQDRKDDYEGNRLPLEAFVAPARRLLRGITLADL